MEKTNNILSEGMDKLVTVVSHTIGKHISEIINQDGDEKSDGQILDEIVQYLKIMNIYKPRT